MPEDKVELKELENRIKKLEERVAVLECKTEKVFDDHHTWLKNIDSKLTKLTKLTELK